MAAVWKVLLMQTGLQGNDAEQVHVPTHWKSDFFFFFWSSYYCSIKVATSHTHLPILSILALPNPPGCAHEVSACPERSVHQSLQESPLLKRQLYLHVLLKVARDILGVVASTSSPDVSELAGCRLLVSDMSAGLHPN